MNGSARTRIKICGITRVADALAAVDAGADALGLMFYEKSSRAVTLNDAATICRALPPFICVVGVFVNPAEEWVRQVGDVTGVGTLQFHGEESPEFCRRFSQKVIKAFRLESEASLGPISTYQVHAWLLDSFVPGQQGGTGAVFNWDLALRLKEGQRPIILAGGLSSQNVAAAVRMVRPFAVDVSSGVESEPGKKDPEKMREFIQAVRGAEETAR